MFHFPPEGVNFAIADYYYHYYYFAIAEEIGEGGHHHQKGGPKYQLYWVDQSSKESRNVSTSFTHKIFKAKREDR